MEYILAMVWKSQMFMDRLIAQIPGMMEMIHSKITYVFIQVITMEIVQECGGLIETFDHT